MKTRIIAAIAMLSIALGTQAQKHEFGNWKRYAKANKELGAPAKGEKRVVLMGNSITDGWPHTRPDFFKNNNLIGRGIGGQTSYQFLLRFREDVINLQPKVVVINYGTNDIAENNKKITLENVLGNIKSMCELAQHHSIKVLLCSILPCDSFSWRPDIKPAQSIITLNNMIKQYAQENGFIYRKW